MTAYSSCTLAAKHASNVRAASQSVGLSEAVQWRYAVIRRVEIKPREHSLAGSFQRGPPDRLQRVCLADEVNRASMDEVVR